MKKILSFKKYNSLLHKQNQTLNYEQRKNRKCKCTF